MESGCFFEFEFSDANGMYADQLVDKLIGWVL